MSLNPIDREILMLLQQDKAEDALELAYKHYFPSLTKMWQATYDFFNTDELEYAFGHAFNSLKKEKKLEAAAPYQDYLKTKGLAFLKSNHQEVTTDHPDVAIIRALLNDAGKALEDFYVQNREEFLGFANKNYPVCDQETVLDVYQEAWMVLIRSYIQRGRIRIINKSDQVLIIIGLRNKASVGTFLFGIAKRMLLKRCSSREQSVDPDDFLKPFFENPNEEENEEQDERITRLMAAFAKLSETCQEILRCKYWYGMSMDEIKEQIGARSAGAVRTRKKRCMDKLVGLF